MKTLICIALVAASLCLFCHIAILICRNEKRKLDIIRRNTDAYFDILKAALNSMQNQNKNVRNALLEGVAIENCEEISEEFKKLLDAHQEALTFLDNKPHEFFLKEENIKKMPHYEFLVNYPKNHKQPKFIHDC